MNMGWLILSSYISLLALARNKCSSTFFFVSNQDFQNFIDVIISRPGVQGTSSGTGMASAAKFGKKVAYVDMTMGIKNIMADTDLHIFLPGAVKSDFDAGVALREE